MWFFQLVSERGQIDGYVQQIDSGKDLGIEEGEYGISSS